jgi:hypothetical protein
MRTRSAGSVMLLGVVLTCASVSRTAWAQEEPSSSDTAAARALGQEGVKLADAGNCQEAVDKLARAEKLFHAPTTLARLGECQVQLGKVVDGTENLNRVVRESLAPGAPAAFVQAQERAKKVLADAKPKIAKLKIAVAGPSDVTWTVKVDNESVPIANLNTNRPIDPGEHVVEASAPGYKTARAKVVLPEGGSDSVALTLEVDPNAPKKDVAAPVAVVTPAPAAATASKPEAPVESRSRTPAYVALGIGVIGAGVGTAFGLMATSKKSDLDSACGAQKQCGPDQKDDIDTGKTFGTVSTVAFVVGAVGLVAGAYLFLASGPTTKTAHAPSKSVGGKTSVRPFIGVDHVGLVF